MSQSAKNVTNGEETKGKRGRKMGRKMGFVFPAYCPSGKCGRPLIGVVLQMPGNRDLERPKIAFCDIHGFFRISAIIKAEPFKISSIVGNPEVRP